MCKKCDIQMCFKKPGIKINAYYKIVPVIDLFSYNK